MKRLVGFVLALMVVVSGCASRNELEEERALEPNTANNAEADLTPIPPSEGDTFAAPAQPVAPAPKEESIGQSHHKTSKKGKAAHKKKNKKISKKSKKAKKTAAPPSDEH